MSIEPKAYRVRVVFGSNKYAHLLCVGYYITPSKRDAAVDCFELVTGSPEEEILEPHDSFRAQLRVFKRASASIPDRDSESLYIQRKMYEAYGEGAQVTIWNVDTSKEPQE
jgi:hypothetical protein